jgi:hypothetical protein
MYEKGSTTSTGESRSINQLNNHPSLITLACIHVNPTIVERLKDPARRRVFIHIRHSVVSGGRSGVGYVSESQQPGSEWVRVIIVVEVFMIV